MTYAEAVGLVCGGLLCGVIVYGSVWIAERMDRKE